MTHRVRNILIAVALAAGAALLTTLYVTNYKKHVQHQQKTVSVVVASKDIPTGMPGSEILKDHLLGTAEVARQTVVPGALANVAQVSDLVATQPVYAGEQVTARRFGPVAATGVRGDLSGVFRAMQVAGNSNQTLVGTIQDGDHVDLVGSIQQPDESSSKHFARVVLRDLLVLKTSGLPTGTSKIGSVPGQDSWVLLRVTDAQAAKLFFVVANAEWTLTLRPTLRSADSPTNLEDSTTVLGTGVPGINVQSPAGAVQSPFLPFTEKAKAK